MKLPEDYNTGGKVKKGKKKRAKKNPSKYNTTNQTILKSITSDLNTVPQGYTAEQLARFAKVQENGGSLIPDVNYIDQNIGHTFQPLEQHTAMQDKINRMKGDPSKIKKAQTALDRDVAIYKQQIGQKAFVADYMMGVDTGGNPSMAYGGSVSAALGDGTVRNYIESPDEAMRENDMAKARAYEDAASNPWTQGLDLVGNMAVQYGTSMMTSGAGGMANGGTVPKKYYGGGEIDYSSSTNTGTALGTEKFMGNNAQGIASALNMLPMLAQMTGPSFAMGGEVPGAPAEIEGGEVVETPQGELLDAQGPSHENGGIPINQPGTPQVEGGSEVYSKRLKGPDGKSFAERKKKRENKESKLEKLVAKSPNDKALKKALDRTVAANEKQDASDREAMKIAQQMQENQQRLEQFAYGGEIGMYSEPDPFRQREQAIGLQPIGAQPLDSNFGYTELPQSEIQPYNISSRSNESGSEEEKEKGAGLNITGGDALGLAGNIMAMNNSRKHARKLAANKIENKDFHKDYGEDALDALDKSKGYIEQQKAQAYKAIEDARTGMTAQTRNSSRGVSQLKVGDLANYAQANKARAGVADNASKQMGQIFGQEAQLENRQDDVRMNAALQKHTSDQKDRAAELSAMAQGDADYATGMQHLGKNVNQMYENRAKGNAMDGMSEHYGADPSTGVVSFKDQASVDANPEFKGLDTESAGKLATAINSGKVSYDRDSGKYTDSNGQEITREQALKLI